MTESVYQCPFCPDRFTSIPAFDRHIATAHSGGEEPVAEVEGKETGLGTRFLRFVMKLCLLFSGIAWLSLFLGTVNAIFGLGIWHSHGYPSLQYQTAPDGSQQNVPGDYWTFLWQFGVLAFGLGTIGAVLSAFVGEEDV
ncbi:MAG: C2H2-type zinc finger protein [Solirubrobacterales bacterium]